MDITIIEISPEKSEQLSEKLDNSLIINADASDQDVLFEEGILNSDALVGLTNMDEQNIQNKELYKAVFFIYFNIILIAIIY